MFRPVLIQKKWDSTEYNPRDRLHHEFNVRAPCIFIIQIQMARKYKTNLSFKNATKQHTIVDSNLLVFCFSKFTFHAQYNPNIYFQQIYSAEEHFLQRIPGVRFVDKLDEFSVFFFSVLLLQPRQALLCPMEIASQPMVALVIVIFLFSTEVQIN